MLIHCTCFGLFCLSLYYISISYHSIQAMLNMGSVTKTTLFPFSCWDGISHCAIKIRHFWCPRMISADICFWINLSTFHMSLGNMSCALSNTVMAYWTIRKNRVRRHVRPHGYVSFFWKSLWVLVHLLGRGQTIVQKSCGRSRVGRRRVQKVSVVSSSWVHFKVKVAISRGHQQKS